MGERDFQTVVSAATNLSWWWCRHSDAVRSFVRGVWLSLLADSFLASNSVGILALRLVKSRRLSDNPLDCPVPLFGTNYLATYNNLSLFIVALPLLRHLFDVLPLFPCDSLQ